MTERSDAVAQRPKHAVAVVAVNRATLCASRLAEEIESVYAKPSPASLSNGILDARKRAKKRSGVPIAAVVPSDRPDLVIVAALERVDRIAVYHVEPNELGDVKGSALRAAFALVDLTIVPDEASEKSAIRAGADPDRIVREDEEICDRLILEPPRKPRRKGAMEMAASLALDAAALSGILRFVEYVAPDQGVNVVNYHRVLPLREITSYCRPQMAIAEPIFEAQLDVIGRLRGFTRVDRVREEHSMGKVAITFDDGYEDNYRVALPILQRFSTPACIFVVTNLIGRPDALWWDRVGLALFVYWRDGCGREPPAALPKRAGALRSTRSFEGARAIISDVISDLNKRSQEDRIRAVQAAEGLVPKLAACRTMLSWDEVDAMARVGITFGAHTKNHVPLDEVGLELAREELFGSRRELDRRLPLEQPNVVALPRGRLGPLTEEEMRKQGVDGVMTSDAGVNRTDRRSLFVLRRDGRMLTLAGRHHPAKLRLELTGVVDRLRAVISARRGGPNASDDSHAGQG